MSGEESELVNHLLFGEESITNFDASKLPPPELDGSTWEFEQSLVGLPNPGTQRHQSCVTDFIAALANRTLDVLKDSTLSLEARARQVHRLAAERQTWHLVQGLLNIHATGDATEFLFRVLNWLTHDHRPFHPRSAGPGWGVISQADAEEISVDETLGRALAGPAISFVQPHLTSPHTLTLNQYAQLVNPYTDGADDGDAASRADPTALVPPECWLGLENYQTLFPKPVDFPKKLWHLVRFTMLSQPQRENLLAVLLECDRIKEHRWLTYNIFGLDLSVYEAARKPLAIDRSGDSRSNGSDAIPLKIDEANFAKDFRQRTQAFVQLQVLRDTEVVLRRNSWRQGCVRLAQSWQSERRKTPNTLHTKPELRWLEPVYHVFGGNVTGALNSPLLSWDAAQDSHRKREGKGSTPKHLLIYDRMWAATRGLFEALQEQSVDDFVSSLPAAKARQRLHRQNAAFQQSKKQTRTTLQDTVEAFEHTLDDILTRVSGTDTGGSAFSSSHDSFSLQRQRSKIIKENDAELEWNTHVRVQVEMVKRIWQSFKSAGLIPTHPEHSTGQPLPTSTITASVVDALNAYAAPRQADSAGLAATRDTNFRRFRVHGLALSSVLHCARREKERQCEAGSSGPRSGEPVPHWFNVAARPNVRRLPGSVGHNANNGWCLEGVGSVPSAALRSWIVDFRNSHSPGALGHELILSAPKQHAGALAPARVLNPYVWPFYDCVGFVIFYAFVCMFFFM